MLQMRPNCECCDLDLAPGDPTALICSFECTWCVDCAATFPDGCCPNCGGDLARRPTQAAAKLTQNPASSTRVLAPDCLGAR